ncbi:hypothetical protein H2201_002522 [Coniosporium apollinis]|uniref:Uncharacterized protein n=1 Tax=Coniosporium apollinis TaxID=61459 RepID=A0ABQ9NY66_9PEZI|nr:hypothetical protein H2201_002522 [Coniosporium apollinis]
MPSPTPLRAFARATRTYFSEPHPHGRYPSTLLSHAPYAPYYAQRIWRTASWYVPATAVLLGWPFATAAVLRRTGI